MLSPEDWHRRFTQQAGWTEPLRRFIFNQIQIPPGGAILEAGSGTGAVLDAVKALLPDTVIRCGIDINAGYLREAKKAVLGSLLTAADVYTLPFQSGTFDACFCHYLFLWLKQPEAALDEMTRVTARGGWVMALAEPDYGGRVDYPASLEAIGAAQTDALARQGANPRFGRRLRSLFQRAGLVNVSAGLLGAEWAPQKGLPPGWELEWEVLAADLHGALPLEELQTAREEDRRAWLAGERILYVPTFYAVGQVR